MTKEAIKNNKHYFTLSIVYGIILGIVYGFWMYQEDMPIWAYVLVIAGFTLAGIAIAFIMTAVKAKKALAKNETIIETQ